MKREEVPSVKVYFINPVNFISVILNTLVELEYETYVINDFDKLKLLKILENDIRNVIFLCITKKSEVDRYLQYIDLVKSLESTHILFGAFVYNNMEYPDKEKLLMNNVSVTPFSEVSSNTLNVFKTILKIFEAKGQRKHICVKARGICDAFITLKGREKPLKIQVLELSTTAFACEVTEDYHDFFTIGENYQEIFLSLRGIRAKTSGRLLGFSRDNRNMYLFKHTFLNVQNSKMVFIDKIQKEVKQKLYTYIKACLKEDITDKLNLVTEESLAEIKSLAQKIAAETEKAAGAEAVEIKRLRNEKKTSEVKKENPPENAEEVEELEEV